MRKLRVGPHTYTVAFVPNVDDEEHVASARGTDEPEELFGHVNHKLLQIHVGLNMRGTQQADSLLHEALHAVLSQSGNDDEQLVHTLTPAILDLLRRNPWFTQFMMEAKA